MSNKQRADHVQANYWGGPISRTEAQKVFDDFQRVILAQAGAIQKLDAAISCVAEKVGVTPEVVNEWLKKKTEEAQKSSLEKAVEKAEGTEPEPSNIIAA